MKNRKIGFFGVDMVDMILYLSRICVNAGKRVLLIDCSDSKRLYYSIPITPKFDVTKQCFDYRGVDYCRQKRLLQEMEIYDIVLLNVGFTQHGLEKYCDTKIICSDCHRDSLLTLLEMDQWKEQKEQAVCHQLVLRYQRKVPAYAVGLFRELIKHTQPTLILKQKFVAMEQYNTYQCEYCDVFDFSWISVDYEEFLVRLVSEIFENKDRKTKNQILRKAKRGD